MICQFCKKSVATVHLTELIDGEKQEIHLCEECARKKGLSIKTHFSLQDLLSGLIEQEKENIPEEVLSMECPVCGLTFREFRDGGRLGCPNDYQVFKEGLLTVLERLHGSPQHMGKVPQRIDSNTAKKRALFDLRRQLEDAISREDYERAAEIRDRIYELEGESKPAAKKSKAQKRSKQGNARGKEKPSAGQGRTKGGGGAKPRPSSPGSGEDKDATG